MISDELDNKRKHKITTFCLSIILDAIKETKYIPKNGDDTNARRSDDFDLIDSEYVIRPSNTNAKEESDQSLIRRRVNVIVDKLKRPTKLSMTDIFKSGQIYTAYQSSNRKPLQRKDYIKVCERYNIKKIGQGVDGKYLVYYLPALKNYINDESIEQLYGQFEPVVKEEDDNQKPNIFPEEPDNPWYELARINGRKGEKAVFYYLIDKFGNQLVEKMDDHVGYDFKIGKSMKVEVKSLTSNKNPIFMSINEIQAADLYTEDYFLYVLLRDKKTNTARLYIIPDPIRFFNIDVGKFQEKQDSSKFASIAPESFRFQLTSSFFKQDSVPISINDDLIQ